MKSKDTFPFQIRSWQDSESQLSSDVGKVYDSIIPIYVNFYEQIIILLGATMGLTNSHRMLNCDYCQVESIIQTRLRLIWFANTHIKAGN